MNIAIVVETFPSLSETFVLSQITGLIDRGHEVDIYAQRADSSVKIHADVTKYGLLDRVYYLPKASNKTVLRYLQVLWSLVKTGYHSPAQLLRVLDLRRYGTTLLTWRFFYSQMPALRLKKYDVIHCHFMFNGPFGLMVRQLNNPEAKVITTFHGCDANLAIQGGDRKKYNWLFKHCDLFTANTQFTAKQAVSLGCSPDKIVKLPVGLDIEKYRYRDAQLPQDSSIKILTVARLVEKKGLEYSIRAVATVLQKHPHLEYWIAGYGPLKSSLQELCHQLGIEEKVRFLGWMDQDEIRNLYSHCHLFVLASVTAANGDKEGQGLVLQEAQATGLPVISTLHNGIPDGVLDGQSGFLVPEKNVEALAQKLEYLIQNPHRWPEMSRAGRRFIETNFDIEILNDRLEQIFETLAHDAPLAGTEPPERVPSLVQG